MKWTEQGQQGHTKAREPDTRTAEKRWEWAEMDTNEPTWPGQVASERGKRTRRTPYRSALGEEGGGVPEAPHAQDPNAQFWAEKWSKMVLPKNDPRPFGKVYGAHLGSVGL